MSWREQLRRIFGAPITATSPTPPDFGELRATLQNPPSEDGWLLLTGLLDHARSVLPPEEFEQQWVDYARDHLKTWPDSLRPCPDHWCEELLQSQGPTTHLQLVRQITLLDKLGHKQAKMRRILACEDLAQVTRVEVGSPELAPQALHALLHEGPWKHLRELQVSRVDLSEMPELLSHPRFDALEVLELHQNELTAPVLERLLDGSFAPGLRDLALLYNQTLGPAGAISLAEQRALTKLRRLEICGCGILEEGLLALTTADHLANLSTLRLRQNGLELDGIAALEQAPWHRLVTLDIAGCGSRGSLAKSLLGFPFREHLEVLDVSGCGLGPEGFSVLAGGGAYSNLRTITLTNNELGGSLRDALASCHWDDMTAIEFDFNGLRDDDVTALLSTAFAPNLERLSLAFNGLGNASARALAGASLSKLELLDLNNNNITDEGAEHLMMSTALSGLHLDISNNLLSDEVRARLDECDLFERVNHHSFKMAPVPVY